MASGAVSLKVGRAAVLLANDAGDGDEPLCEAAVLDIAAATVGNCDRTFSLRLEVRMPQVKATRASGSCVISRQIHKFVYKLRASV